MPPMNYHVPLPICNALAPLLPKLYLKSVKCGGCSWFPTSTMPPNRTSPQQTFNPDILEPETLVTPGGFQAALNSIERVCYRDDSSIAEMVVGLSNRPYILEYIFSGTSCTAVVPWVLIKQTVLAVLDHRAYERLTRWIIAQFPTPATFNVMGALGVELLKRLSSSLTSVEGVSTAEHRNELREFRRKVGLSLNVLKELGGCTDQASVGANMPPISHTGSKAPSRRVQLDPDPFDSMGIAVPTTEDEVRAVCGDILPRLQSILGVRVPLSLWLASKY